MKGSFKEVVVVSGKGGAGKTSVTAALVHLASRGIGANPLVIADADVDAPNLEMVLDHDRGDQQEFWGGQRAVIDPERCDACGLCATVCRFDAVHQEVGGVGIDPTACEGCAACFHHCPRDAVRMVPLQAGRWFRSATPFGTLFHAALRPGSENSGKLVTLIKQRAESYALEQGVGWLLVDGPPGVGCPVIAAVSGADYVLIVAEPGLAGQHDAGRVLDLVEHFGLESGVCVNKCDLYPEGTQKLEAFFEARGAPLLGRVPYDLAITQAMAHAQPVTKHLPDSRASGALQEVWEALATAMDGSY